jgi:fibronectin-binding autotransporter adhesin
MRIASRRPARLLAAALVMTGSVLAAEPAAATRFLSLADLQDGSSGGTVPGLDGASAAAVSPDGSYVYATSDVDDSIVLFARNPDDTLTFVTQYKNGLGGFSGLRSAKDITISADGSTVYTAALLDDTVAVHSRDTMSGQLTFIEKFVDGVGLVDCLNNPETVVVSPDDECVYATGRADNGIAVFDRNTSTGALTYVSCLRDAAGGVTGLVDPGDIALSPDSAFVYATGSGSDSVVIFARSAPACGLTYVDSITNGQLDVIGLDRPEALAVSPDGAQVYVASSESDGVVVLDRNYGTGLLSFVQFAENRRLGFGGLDGARSLVIGPAGDQVFVGSAVDETITVLARDAGTGMLSMVQTVATGIGGGAIAGMETNALAISADYGSLYAAATESDAVDAFRLLSAVQCPGVPASDCHVPVASGKAALKIGDRDGTRHDSLSWKWSKGQLTTNEEFGDVTSTATLAACIYDASGPGGSAALVAQASVVPGACGTRPCWRVGSSGLKYNDKYRAPDGVSKVLVKQGLDGKARIVVKAQGELLGLPTLPLALPVTVQLVGSSGECWESVHSDARRNESSRFKAVSD